MSDFAELTASLKAAQHYFRHGGLTEREIADAEAQLKGVVREADFAMSRARSNFEPAEAVTDLEGEA